MKRRANNGKWMLWVAPLVLVLVGWVAYANSFRGAFVFDESQSVLQSSKIRFEETSLQDWLGPRMVGDISFALNYRMGGQRVGGYHAVNLCIHLGVALLAYGLIRRTLTMVPAVNRFGMSPEGIALFIALLWVVHPLTTSAVTYVYQRYELLMALFYVLALYALCRGGVQERGRMWYLVAILSCFLGMASKEVMITAPVVALIYDRVFLANRFAEILRKRWWVYGGMGLSWLLLAWLMSMRMTQDGAFDQIYGKLSFPYAVTQCRAIGHYLRLAIWPHPLCLDYGWPLSAGLSEVGLPCVLVGSLGIATLIGLRVMPRLAFPGLFFFVVLSPTSSVVARPDPVFEHRMYLPLLAVLALVVVCFYRACMGVMAKRLATKTCCKWCTVFLSAVVLCYGLLTWNRNLDYHSRRTMWEDVVEKAPWNLRAYVNLASACLDEGDMAAAGAAAQALLQRAPAVIPGEGGDEGISAKDLYRHFDGLYCAQAENILGIVFLDQGDLERAETHLRSATRWQRNFLDPYVNLALVFARRGETEKAITWWKDALSLAPGHVGALVNLVDLYEREGRFSEAVSACRQLVEAYPARNAFRVRLSSLEARAAAADKPTHP